MVKQSEIKLFISSIDLVNTNSEKSFRKIGLLCSKTKLKLINFLFTV